MLINANVNLSQGAEVSAELSINNALKSLKIVQAAELEDLSLVLKAVSVCARRDKARAEVKFGAESLEVRRADMLISFAEAREAARNNLANETASEVLRLLQ